MLLDLCSGLSSVHVCNHSALYRTETDFTTGTASPEEAMGRFFKEMGRSYLKAPAVALSRFLHHLSFSIFEYIPWVSFLERNGTSVFIAYFFFF